MNCVLSCTEGVVACVERSLVSRVGESDTTRVSRNLEIRGSLEGQTDCAGVGRMVLKYWPKFIAVANSTVGRVTRCYTLYCLRVSRSQCHTLKLESFGKIAACVMTD